MNLSELQSDYMQKKIITYASDHNTAVEKKLLIQQVCGNLYKGKDKKDSYGQTFCHIYIYYKDFGIGIDVGSISRPEERSTEDLISRVSPDALQGAQGFISALDSIVAAEGRTRNAEIALARYLAPEKADSYAAARQRHIDKAELEKAQKQQERDAEDAAYCEQKNKEAQCKVEEAVHIIRNGGRLSNTEITFYKSRYSSSSYSMVNHLARLYEVEIPLKVQGWINQRLLGVTITDGRVTSYQHKGGKSNTFPNYIGKLLEAVHQCPSAGGAA